MLYHTHLSQQPPRAQRGAVLAISLIFLVILTIIGIVGMNTSILGTMMSSSLQFQTTALGDAEVALKRAEDQVETITSDGVPLDLNGIQTDPYYDATGTSAQLIDPAEWTWVGEFPFVDNTNGATWAIPDANRPPPGTRYVIQYGGKEPIPGNTGGLGGSVAYGGGGGGTAGAFVNVFLVSAQGEGFRGAKRIVQTVYVTNDDP